MSWAIWITGRPGSGKSTIARAAAARLAERGETVHVLELDALRRVLTPAPRYDAAERDAVYRALVAIARALTRAGCPVLIDATAHRRGWRDLARAVVERFAEVQLVCPLDVAQERERTRAAGHHPPNIYAQAGHAGATVPGVDVPYELAVSPELVIDTTRVSAEDAAARVAALAETFPPPAAPRRGDSGWALWISGRPGSGKTTLAAEVRAQLEARGVPTAVIDTAAFAALVAPGGMPSRLQREMTTRAVVIAARHLVEAGRAVVIEGAVPMPDADQLARALVAPFVCVELVCPPDVCRTRERAVRWNLVPFPVAAHAPAPPDLGLDYEAVLRPDLVLYTDLLDARMSAEEVLRLVGRLERAARERRAPCESST